jgi:hypothetical protein
MEGEITSSNVKPALGFSRGDPCTQYPYETKMRDFVPIRTFGAEVPDPNLARYFTGEEAGGRSRRQVRVLGHITKACQLVLAYSAAVAAHGPTPVKRSGAIRVTKPGILRIDAGGKSAFGPR